MILNIQGENCFPQVLSFKTTYQIKEIKAIDPYTFFNLVIKWSSFTNITNGCWERAADKIYSNLV